MGVRPEYRRHIPHRKYLDCSLMTPAQANSRSVKAKARVASGDAVRQGSSAAAAATRWLISVTGPVAAGRAGSSEWEQFDATMIIFISARRSTKSPALLRPSCQRNRPASSNETGAKNVTQGGMSLTSSPILEAAARKFS